MTLAILGPWRAKQGYSPWKYIVSAIVVLEAQVGAWRILGVVAWRLQECRKEAMRLQAAHPTKYLALRSEKEAVKLYHVVAVDGII